MDQPLPFQCILWPKDYAHSPLGNSWVHRGCLGKDPGHHHWGRAPPVLEHRWPQLWALGHGSACLLCPCPSLSGTPWSTQILTQSCAPDVT